MRSWCKKHHKTRFILLTWYIPYVIVVSTLPANMPRAHQGPDGDPSLRPGALLQHRLMQTGTPIPPSILAKYQFAEAGGKAAEQLFIEHPDMDFGTVIRAYRRARGLERRRVRENAVRALLNLPESAIKCAGGYPPDEAQPSRKELAELDAIIDRTFAPPGKVKRGIPYGGIERLSQYGPTTGFEPLKQVLERRLSAKGVVVKDKGEVLIGNGSQEILYGVAKALLSQNLPDGHSILLGGLVAVESPTYIGALDAFDTNGAEYVHIPKDENGIVKPDDLDALLTFTDQQAQMLGEDFRIKMVYLGPTFQNPTGVTIPEETRRKLADVMGKHPNTVLVEDNPYGEIRWNGAPLEESIQSMMRKQGHDNAVYISTFSKTFSPGAARVGYGVFPDGFPVPQGESPEPLGTLANAYIHEKQSIDLFTSTLNQARCWAYLSGGVYDTEAQAWSYSDGKYDKQLPEKIRIYHEKSDALFDAFTQEPLPQGIRINKPMGGMFFYVELPDGMDAGEVQRELIKVDKEAYPDDEAVAVVPVTAFYGDQWKAKNNGLRICYTTESLDRLRFAGRKLNRVINQLAA